MKKSRFIPYGYTVRNGRTVVEHTEASVIREIFEQYINGASLKEIAESLTARKIPYTEKKDVWNKARISRIIENAKYTGDGEYDPIIEEETFETAVITKNARKRVEIENECLGISLLRNRVKCGECGYPMVRHTNSKYRIRESWTCQNPECGCRVRILDSHLLEKINVGINRIIENNELMIPHKRTTKATSPAVEELQGKINLELTKETPSEEYIVSLVSDMASQMYRETDAKLMIAARVARQRASMMVQQDEFCPDYFADLISYVTLDGNGKVRLVTKTETVIEEGTE